MGGTWGDFGETTGDVGKSGVLAISLKRVKMDKLLWRAYRKSPTLFRTVLSPTPYGVLSPRLEFATPTQNFNRYYLMNG